MPLSFQNLTNFKSGPALARKVLDALVESASLTDSMSPPRAKCMVPEIATCLPICQAPTLTKISEHHFLYAHLRSHDNFSLQRRLSVDDANFNFASLNALLLGSGPTSNESDVLHTLGINGMFPDIGMTSQAFEAMSKGVFNFASQGKRKVSLLRNLFQHEAKCLS